MIIMSQPQSLTSIVAQETELLLQSIFGQVGSKDIIDKLSKGNLNTLGLYKMIKRTGKLDDNLIDIIMENILIVLEERFIENDEYFLHLFCNGINYEYEFTFYEDDDDYPKWIISYISLSTGSGLGKITFTYNYCDDVIGNQIIVDHDEGAVNLNIPKQVTDRVKKSLIKNDINLY